MNSNPLRNHTVEISKLYLGNDYTIRQIGQMYGVTKNAMMGFCYRHFGTRKEARKRTAKRTKAKPQPIQQLRGDKQEDLDNFTEPQYLPDAGCCKYPVGVGPKYRWCKESPVRNGYCEKHYNKCHSSPQSKLTVPYEGKNTPTLFVDSYWDNMRY